ncbi:MAG TPA: 16S rRNA processing protein RimM [Candidatus Avacidaminococcus intestinavium]|uniref:Ribosome maturation factor RimM n=1 Tax=Candidatus Avacidaminococcus intestinavium TaxID=2840684 RepID=A0A9D1MP05_9FIRM|nr:16S rRNA processing protein RimM [Candidatus Avacidaminococcus intestinavium]
MDKQIVIGAIVAPHGVRGEFRVLPLTETPDLFLKLTYLLLDNGKKLHIKAARLHKNVYLIKVDEINSMDEANLLRGQNVYVNSIDLPPLQEDQYYVADLLGFEVYDTTELFIGTLKDVLPTGSNDVFVVQDNNGKELLIPALKTNIRKVDVAARRIVALLPEWAD